MKLYLRTKQLRLSLKYLIDILVLRKTFPLWAYITLTRKCNLNCPYCYVLDTSAPALSVNDTIYAIDKLYNVGTRWISFTGGEPTMRRKELLAGIRHASLTKGMFTQLPTNGTLLTSEYLDALGQAGLDLLDISLDSLKGHESKKGLSDRNTLLVKEILAAQKKYGFIFKANFVLNTQNISEVTKILEFCHEQRILLSLRMAFPSPGEKEVHHTTNSGFFTTQDLLALRNAINVIITKKRQGYAVTEPISYYQLWEKFVTNPGQHWHCEAGEYCLGIDSDSQVRICNSLPAQEGRTPLTVAQLDKQYSALLKEQAAIIKKDCQQTCLAAAYYCSQDYRRHPLGFLKDSFYLKPFFTN